MSSKERPERPVPELLAPAGGPAELRAALAAGADAVYVGLRRFSMRARASNFGPDELAAGADTAHRAGARLYAAVNTVVFDDEWDEVRSTVEEALAARVDALIVADLGLLRRLRQWVPELELHASTQTTVHHPGQLELLASLGVRRVVLARELPLDEIRAMAEAAGRLGLQVETFAHGALCVSYSGQCYAGAILSGRSANRGACPQLCRLSYRCVEGHGTHAHPISLRDLWTLPRLGELAATGVACIKIEGRLKTAEYVHDVTRAYRRALDALAAGRPVPVDELTPSLEEAFNRGFTQGGPGGELGTAATTADSPNRKLPVLGTVASVDIERLVVGLQRQGGGARVDPGTCLIFRGARGEDLASCYVTKVFPDGSLGVTGIGARDLEAVAGTQALRGPDSEILEATRRLVEAWEPPPIPLRMSVTLESDGRLRVEASRPRCDGVSETSGSPLEPSRARSFDHDLAATYLGRLGGTPYALERLVVDVPEGLFVPPAELNRMRRRLVELLDASVPPALRVGGGEDVEDKEREREAASPLATRVSVAVASLEAVRAAVAAGAGRLYLPPDDGLWAEDPGVERWLLTPAITPPPAFARLTAWIESHRDVVAGVLAGNSAVGSWCHSAGCPFWADHSWNVTNARSARVVRDRGASGVTWSPEATVEGLLCGGGTHVLPTEFVVAGRPPLLLVRLADLPDHCRRLRDPASRELLVEGWTHAPGATLWGQPRDRRTEAGPLRGRAAFLRVEGRPDMAPDELARVVTSLV